jgi:phenylacetate-coenzyme A ligase PaaK-like adenylate-forming protein
MLLQALVRYRRLAREQWLPAETIRRLQWQRLQIALRHAFANSPFYRRRFLDLGITPADIRSEDDLARIPVTTREDLREAENLIARGFEKARLKHSLTSGSTGRRTTSYFDADAWMMGKHLLKLRARFACGVRPWDRIALLQETQSAAASSTLLGRTRSFSIHRPIAVLLPELQAFAPSVLYGFPGHLLRVGRAAANGLKPRLVFTSGEMLDELTRSGIEEAFGTRVLDVYGCTEVKEIAWECPRREGYHVNADWLLLEVQPAGPNDAGRRGALLVTCLYNRAMPLLRYQIGDTGELLERACGCGRGLPLARPTLGRSVDYISLKDGTLVPPYDLTCAIEDVAGMRQYQIVQRTLDRLEVLIVPCPEFDEGSRRQIRERLRPILRGITAEIRLVDEIAPEPSGKYRIVMSQAGAGPGVDSGSEG